MADATLAATDAEDEIIRFSNSDEVLKYLQCGQYIMS